MGTPSGSVTRLGSSAAPSCPSRPACGANRGRPARSRWALAVLALFAAGPAAAWVVDQKSTLNIAGSGTYASAFEILDLPVIPYAGLTLSGGCCGVGGSASGHVELDARMVIDSSNGFDLASKASARTFMFTADAQPTVGDSFFLVNKVDSLGIQKLNMQSKSFAAYAGLFADLGGSISGHACLGLCVSASLKLKVAGPLPLASVDSGGLEVFGSLVDTSLPYSFSGFGGMASASANIPSFAKTFTNLAPGAAAVMAPKQESVLSAKLDVAGLVAKAAGFPIPLKGDLLGIGYELLSLDAFAGLNLEHAFTFKPLDLKTTYSFSSPVEVFSGGSWSAPVTQLTMADGEAAQLRSPFATSLGISSVQALDYKVDYDFDLLLDAGVDLSALELHGLGLSLGPLIDPDPWKINLGKFDVGSGSKTGKLAASGIKTTVKFDPLKLDADGQTVIENVCAIPGVCSQTGYVTARENLGAFVRETTYRVTNFGVGRCDGTDIAFCEIDPDFVPVVTQVRAGEPSARDDNTELLAFLRTLGFVPGPDGLAPVEVVEYAGDFDQIAALLAAAPLVEAPAASADTLRAGLRALGVDPDNPFPPRAPLTGAPPLTQELTANRSASIELSVPEPSVPALLLAAGLIFWTLRRRSSLRQPG